MVVIRSAAEAGDPRGAGQQHGCTDWSIKPEPAASRGQRSAVYVEPPRWRWIEPRVMTWANMFNKVCGENIATNAPDTSDNETIYAPNTTEPPMAVAAVTAARPIRSKRRNLTRPGPSALSASRLSATKWPRREACANTTTRISTPLVGRLQERRCQSPAVVAGSLPADAVEPTSTLATPGVLHLGRYRRRCDSVPCQRSTSVSGVGLGVGVGRWLGHSGLATACTPPAGQ